MIETGKMTRGVISIAFGLALGGFAASARLLASGPEPPDFVVRDFGVVPRSAHQRVLLKNEGVRKELKITEAQKAEHSRIERQFAQEFVKARQGQAPKDAAKAREARVAFNKLEDDAIVATLTAKQRERLDQIQLQALGPLAFALEGTDKRGMVEPALEERLEMSEDQVRRARAIFQESIKQIEKAASFPIALATEIGRPTEEAVRQLVESAEFQAAKDKAGGAGREASAAVVQRIEQVLNDKQRVAYRRLLGEPFDFSKLRTGAAGRQAGQLDRMLVADLVGVGARAPQLDASFKASVARPAYAGAGERVRVLFDEAHHSLFTASGLYKPFADLISNDGYLVILGREPFSAKMLERANALIIANARGADFTGGAGAASPAFSEAECDAVRDWINGGGSLLLIAGAGPPASAAARLATRLGVTIGAGATFDRMPAEGGATTLLFTRENRLLGDHSIVRGRDEPERVNRVQTFNGTSLIGPPGSVQILRLGDSAVLAAGESGKLAPAAGRALGLAFPFGKGRVVVLADATLLAAQDTGGVKLGMNVPGVDNRQLGLNIMHWLSGLLEPREGTAEKTQSSR